MKIFLENSFQHSDESCLPLCSDLAESMKRPTRIVDSWGLTDGRCSFTMDGNHFLPLDKFKILSLLQELTF